MLKEQNKIAMDKRKKQTTSETRHLIIRLHEEGKSVRKIGKIVDRCPSTVHAIIKRYQQNFQVENKSRIGQGKKLNDYDERRILREIKTKPFKTANELKNMVKTDLKKDVCAETIRNVLRKNDLHGRIARKKPYISKKNKIERVKFCKDYLLKDSGFWNTVLFTDESKFNLHGSDGKQYVWRKSNTEFLPKNTRATVKHGGGSVMVWGCVSSAGVGNIHFIEGKMNRFQYLNILKQNVKQSADKLNILDTFAFYQDNDPKHTSHVAKMWLIYNCPKLLKTPAQSPDLNIIEHVWEELARKLYKSTFNTVEQFKQGIRSEWNNITPEFCANLVQSMPRRLEAVIKAKGFASKY